MMRVNGQPLASKIVCFLLLPALLPAFFFPLSPSPPLQVCGPHRRPLPLARLHVDADCQNVPFGEHNELGQSIQ